MRYTSPKLLEHLASAYVLGTLKGGARRRFERLKSDRMDVRARVHEWEMRLGQLASSILPKVPSERVWKAIEARTLPSRVHTAAGNSQSWLGGLVPAGWGLGGLAAGALAASVLFITVPTLFVSSEQIAMRSGERLPASYVGLLTDAQGNGKYLVSSLRHGKTMTVKVIGAVPAPATGRLVLWAFPADGPAFAVGVVPTSGSAVSSLPDTSEQLFSKVTKLAISLESDVAPASPTGTSVYSGNCAKLW